MKFTTNFKTMCNYKPAHFGIQYEGESITSLNLRMNIHTEEENQDMKFLLITIGMFAKM